VTLNVFANHFRRHFVADGSGEVPVFPELSAPELPFDLWELSEHGSRTETFEPRHYLRYRVAWWKRTEQVDMVGADFHLIYRDVIGFSYLPEHLLDTLGQSTLKDVLAILRRPDQVIGCIVSCVRRSSEDHARILSTSAILRAGIEPALKMVHPSPPQAAGHCEPFS
jgi:hypothetical protein